MAKMEVKLSGSELDQLVIDWAENKYHFPVTVVEFVMQQVESQPVVHKVVGVTITLDPCDKDGVQ